MSDDRIKIVDGKVIFPTVKLKMIDYKPTIDPKAALALMDHIAQSLGIPAEEFNKPTHVSSQMAYYAAFDLRATEKLRAWREYVSRNLYAAWEELTIVYEDEYMGEVRPLAGRILIKSRTNIDWVTQ